MSFHAAQYDGNLGYLAQDDRQLISGLLDDAQGVFNGPNSSYSGLQVSAGAGLTSSVAIGRGAVLNSYQSTQGGLWVVRNDSAEATSAHAAPIANPRWDCVGVRVYDSDTGGDSSDVTVPLIVQGTESSSASKGSATNLYNLGSANMTGAPGQSGGPSFPNNFLPLVMVLIPYPIGSSSSSFSYLDWRTFLTGGLIDSGWFSPIAETNVTTTNLLARLLGDRVYFAGHFYVSSSGLSAGASVFTLPSTISQYSVSGSTFLAVSTSSSGQTYAQITRLPTSSIFQAISSIATGNYSLDGESYTVTY